jgi:hypothetical protein
MSRPAQAPAETEKPQNGTTGRVLPPDVRAVIVRALARALVADIRRFPPVTVTSPAATDHNEQSHE